MLTAPLQRTLIIGNSGSGKSTLARRIALKADCAVTSLDEVYWIDQMLLHKRGAVAAKQLATEASLAQRWVIEGVYGWLIDAVSPRATHLVWLDMPWAECKAGLLARGSAGGSDAEFAGLVVWAEQYWNRQSSSSHAAHALIFHVFPGAKTGLHSRREVELFAGRR